MANERMFTEEEAIEAAGVVSEMIGPAFMGMFPPGFENVMASIVLCFDEAASGECDCPTCTRLREVKTDWIDNFHV